MWQWPFEWLAARLCWLLALQLQTFWERWPQRQKQGRLAVWQRRLQEVFALARDWPLGVSLWV